MPKIPNENRIQKLSIKWMNGTINEEEKQEYDLWYTSFEDDRVQDLSEEDIFLIKERLYESLKNSEFKDRLNIKRKPWKGISIMIAASVLLLILFGIYFHSFVPFGKESDKLYSVIKPGRDKAILSFDNGTIYDLDSLEAGRVMEDNGVRIEKTDDGQLIYSVINTDLKNELVLVNTVTTPQGGQYKIRLPDGSMVWLNAASSLKFPTVFNDEVRIVELSGEAYFEVSKNKDVPFKVLTNKETIEVLGTSFNVNSYENEKSSMTTLIEGKVKVSASNLNEKILSPGQQSIIIDGNDIQVHEVDIQEFIAWKNGEFIFNNESIESVMRKVARWYDVELVYEAEVKEVPIWGSVSRYENISEVLNIIELTGAAHFKIDGRRIYVMK